MRLGFLPLLLVSLVVALGSAGCGKTKPIRPTRDEAPVVGVR